ncbi:MAG: hypothetical protein K2P68_08930 [Sphingomonas sp.]|nr:hypothetical protein [Sphingomonas sp.]
MTRGTQMMTKTKLLTGSVVLVLGWCTGLVMAQDPSAPVVAASSIAAGSWRTLTTEPYPGKRDDVSFADADHGWYGTGKGDLFATSDGGEHWEKVASRPGTFIRAVGFVDAKTGFIGNIGTDYYPGVTDTTPLYRTDDGGVTWQPVDLGGKTVAGICAIDIVRTSRIYQGKLVPRTIITAAGRVGGPTGMIRSVDGGDTWTVTDLSDKAGMILDVKFFDEQTGLIFAASSRDAATGNALILRTTDGGKSWTEVYKSKRPAELIWKASFVDARTGYATVMSYDESATQKYIVKTVDGGRTWNELPLVNNGKAVELGIGFIDATHGWVGTTVGGFETSDGGKTFVPAPIARAANKFRFVKTPQGTRVYAIGTALQRLDIAARN